MITHDQQGLCHLCFNPFMFSSVDEGLEGQCPTCGRDTIFAALITATCENCGRTVILPARQTPPSITCAHCNMVSGFKPLQRTGSFKQSPQSRTSVQRNSASLGKRVLIWFLIAAPVIFGFIAAFVNKGRNFVSWYLPEAFFHPTFVYLLLGVLLHTLIGAIYRAKKEILVRIALSGLIVAEFTYLSLFTASTLVGILLGAVVGAAYVVVPRALSELNLKVTSFLLFLSLTVVLFANERFYPSLKLNTGIFGDKAGIADIYSFPLSSTLAGLGPTGEVVTSFSQRGGGTMQILAQGIPKELEAMVIRWVRKGNVLYGFAVPFGKDQKDGFNFTLKIVSQGKMRLEFGFKEQSLILAWAERSLQLP